MTVKTDDAQDENDDASNARIDFVNNLLWELGFKFSISDEEALEALEHAQEGTDLMVATEEEIMMGLDCEGQFAMENQRYAMQRHYAAASRRKSQKLFSGDPNDLDWLFDKTEGT